jgi:hypothetical protein
MSDTDCSVIYFLLREYPDALRLLPHHRKPAALKAIVAPPEAAVIDLQAQNKTLRSQNESLRAALSLKDANIDRLWKEIARLRTQIDAQQSAEIEDPRNADDGSSSIRNSSAVDGENLPFSEYAVAACANGLFVGIEQLQEALLNGDNNHNTAAPPPSKTAKTSH